jgi:long-subunit acyl-CoA synthetase (AMP-forming)
MAKDIGADAKALWWEDPTDSYEIREWTWAQYYDDTMKVARSLIELGVEPFSSVSIIGFNAPHWNMACLGAMAAGAKAAGIYATNEPAACEYIVEHSESTVIVVENDAQVRACARQYAS